MGKFKLIESYLISFLKDEVYKTSLKKVVVGISGGLDSAVVATLAKKAFQQNVLGIMMPSSSSSQSSIKDAKELCSKFNILYEVIPISPLVDTYFKGKDKTNLRVGNFSARIRMSILYDISARESALVLGTSNKSELLLGYGTLFGDLSSAINPIGDIYKSELFEFAKYLGIPSSIINKPPSADLWEGQSDEEDLGYSYKELDSALKAFVDERMSEKEMLKNGFDKELITLIKDRIFKNQFKRMMPIIAKISERTINHDFLYPRDIKS